MQGRPWWLTIQPIRRACAAVSPERWRRSLAPRKTRRESRAGRSRLRGSFGCSGTSYPLQVAGVVVAAAAVESAAGRFLGAVECFPDKTFELLLLLLREVEPVFSVP